MPITMYILILIVVVNAFFALLFIKDIFQRKNEFKKEKGNSLLLSMTSPIIFFFSSFGISDFAISTILYRKLKLVSDRNLPGTLNTQCVLPVAVMALAFISVIEVDATTLITCIVAQVIGAYFGPRYVVKLPTHVIRLFIGVGLILATGLIVASKMHLIPSGGSAIGLTGDKLAIAAVLLCLFGALNNIGIGSYAPTMITVFALGMNPAAAFPIMMGACTLSVSIGSMQFIKYGQYSQKITLFTSTFGVIGVLLGVYFVKELNIAMLQWLVAGILLLSGIQMLLEELKKQKREEALC